MRPAIPLAALAVATLLVLPGCSDDGSNVLDGPSDELTAALQEVVFEADALAADVLAAETDQAAASSGARGETSGGGSITRSVNATRSCPAGGAMTIQGSLTRTRENSGGSSVVEVEASGNQSAADCTFVREELTVTLNGASQWQHFRRWVDGVFDGPQTSSYSGSWHALASNGQERSCEFDFTVVRDPGAHTRTIEGTLCGFRMRRHVDWSPRD